MSSFESVYNKGYDDGFSDAINSFDDDDYISIQEIIGWEVRENKLFLYTEDGKRVFDKEGNINE